MILPIDSRLCIHVASNNLRELKIHDPNCLSRPVNQNILNPNVSVDHAKGMDFIVGLENLQLKCRRQT